jgi:hypothetical protein
MDDELRQEVAAVAARLVAESGLDYRSARQKAARQVFGGQTIPRNAVPDDETLEDALREHLALFDPGHAQRLVRRRRVALEWMAVLEPYRPLATGAVWRGLATEQAPIHLQLFHDDPKEIEIELLNRGVRFEVSELPAWRGRDGTVEALSFIWRGEPVLLSLHDSQALRGALHRDAQGRADRGDRAALLELFAQSPEAGHD